MLRKTIYAILLVLFAAGGYSQNLNNPNKRGPLGTQINTYTGNLVIPRVEFLIPGRGFNLDMKFFYNSYGFDKRGAYGNGWSFQFDMSYYTDTNGAKIIVWGDGREDKYDSLPGALYKAPPGYFSKFYQTATGKYLLVTPDSTHYYFDNAAHRKVTRLEEPNGSFVQLAYTDTLLASITNSTGQSISFSYTQGKLTAITDALSTPARTWSYTYFPDGNLKDVTDPLGGKKQYTYLVNGPMKTLTDKNNNKIDIIYFPDFSLREIIGCNQRLSLSYDTFYKKTVITDYLEDGNNQVTTYTYEIINGAAWVSAIQGSCCGIDARFKYDSEGNVTEKTDANGNKWLYTYDNNGNIITATNPLGQTVTYTWSPTLNEITSFKDEKGNLYNMTYDARGNMTEMTAPGNHVYKATFNSNGDILSSTDGKGNVFYYEYDAYGNPSTVTGPNGYKATLAYDARGYLLSFTDSKGNTVNGEYDMLGRLKKVTDPLNFTQTTTYDAQGNATGFTNEENATTAINYDASNRPVKLVDALGNAWELSYTAMNKVKSVKDPLGNITRLNYDKKNRLKTYKNSAGEEATFEYDNNGNIVTLRKENGQVVNYEYDALSRVTRISDQQGDLLKYTYDATGLISSFTDASGASISAVYDDRGRPIKTIDALGNATSYTYDKSDNVVSLTDRNGQTTHYTYDSLNRVKTFTDKNSHVITVGYDAEDNVVSLTDQKNNTTTYEHDGLNRVTRMNFPGGTYQSFTRDKRGNVVTRRLTDGSAILYAYDSLDRMVRKTMPGGEVFTYTYDKAGRVMTATNNAGTVTFTYDAINRISSESFDGRTTTYQYNTVGRTQSTTYPDGSIVLKEFDARNRLVKISKNNTLLAEYVYNEGNLLVGQRFGNGINSILQYDLSKRLNSHTTGIVQQSVYSYDKVGNKLSVNRLGNTSLSEAFTYDNNFRLTNYKRGVIGGTPSLQHVFSYDEVGNRTGVNTNGVNTAYTINHLNQVTTRGAVNFTYDARGNLTYDGSYYKTYDAEGRLLKDSASPSNKLIYTYDAFNRRVTKSINGTLYKYTYNGAMQIEERAANNSLLNTTVFKNFRYPVSIEKNGSTYFYHQNELGSVEAITNEAGGITETYRYDAFGKLSRFDHLGNALNSSIAGNRVGFTGQEYDSATNSYRFFYRNYSPETGTFNQRDPLGYKDGMGMYQYVKNNPANGVDVWGLYGHYESFNPELGPQPYEEWHGEKVEFKALDDFISKALSRTNYLFGRFEKFGDAIEGKAIETVNKVVECGLSAKGTLRRYHRDAWAIAVLGKKHAKEMLYDLEKSVVKNANKVKKLAEEKIPDMLNKGKNKLNWLGEKLGVVEMVYKGGKIVNELGNGISPAGQDEWDAIGDFATTGLGNLVKPFGAFDFWLETGSGKNTYQQLRDWTGGGAYEVFLAIEKKRQYYQEAEYNEILNSCPPPAGLLKKPRPPAGGDSDSTKTVEPVDPNEIIGPRGFEETKKWVSVKDRMPYTILCENDVRATAPAKYIRISTKMEVHQDANTFELGTFGFNNQEWSIPPGLTAYYTRLDCRDSMGLYVDVVAGYDQMRHEAFWEFRSIDPATLLPTEDPMAGLLFLQDSTQPTYGHGFVTFSIKPKETARTLDTIGAMATIVFDTQDSIPTNIYTNTIDALAPQSQLTSATVIDNEHISLTWSGTDDAGGSGIHHYSLYVSKDGVNFSLLTPYTTRTDTVVRLGSSSNYCFFVLATDNVGNTDNLRPELIRCATLGGALPLNWLYFRGNNKDNDNVLDWATTNESDTKEFVVERSKDGATYTAIGTVKALGSSGNNLYSYTDRNIQLLGSEVFYYRLRQVDVNDSYRYSSVVRLTYRNDLPAKSIVYPNPSYGTVYISVGDKKLMGSEAVMTDMNGRILSRFRITASTQPVNLSNVAQGIYFITLQNKEVLKIVKQ